jgi:hypothetical protein
MIRFAPETDDFCNCLFYSILQKKPPRSRARGRGLRARARATDDLRALWLGRSDPVGLAGYGLIIQATQP